MTAPPGPLRAERLVCENLVEPLAIDTPRPRFSWIVAGDGRGRAQSAWRLVVRERDAGRLLWDSGRIADGETLNIVYAGETLPDLTACTWSVEVWDERGQPSPPAQSTFETGLIAGTWPAPWICVPPSKGAKPPEATLAFRNRWRCLNVSYLRRGFSLGGKVKSARLYATALGAYRFHINGKRVGDDLLTPSFTDYHVRVEYQAYDVTAHLREGANAIAAMLGEGWYSGYLGLDLKRPAGIWGRKPQVSAFLDVTLEDGRAVRLMTDGAWRHSLGPLIYSDMLKGEKYDARLAFPGWDGPGFDDSAWEPAGTDAGAAALVNAAKAPPVRVTRELSAQSVKRAPDGGWVFDLGQNMVGTCRLRFEVKAGREYRMVHAEVLADDGSLYLDNLRTANQEDIYVAAADGAVTYEPTFTYHGFRYVGLYGPEVEPPLSAVTGLVINSDLPETSRFDSSNTMLNQLYLNILWSQRGNFVSVPTDCPQRDERLGWTADGQIFARTAAYNMDVSAFFTKWMTDIIDEQSEEGAFPDVAPRATSANDGAPAWGDAGIILPMELYRRYADRRILEESYPAMGAWIEFIRRHNPGYLRENRNHNNYGDWLALGETTSNTLVATAYYALIVNLMRQAAEALAIPEDVAYYATLFERIRDRFRGEYVHADGSIEGNTQTSYFLALHVGLVPEPLVGKAVEHLVANIRSRDGGRVTTGFLGVRHICPILSEFGHADLAWQLATSEKFPSWGYSIVNGATTIWERWDGWTREKGFQVPNMNSFNHYAYGSIGEWLFEWAGGIAPIAGEGAYRRFLLRPTPGGGLTHTAVEYDSPRGRIASRWQRRDDGGIDYRFEVPANTRAILEIPATEGQSVTLNGAPAAASREGRYGGPRFLAEVGSGGHTVTVAGRP